MTQPPTQQMLLDMAADLLWTVWTEIDSEYKARYRMDIWTQFESRVASVAQQTTNLTQFLSRLCGKFAVATPGGGEAERAMLARILRGEFADPDAVLQVIREYPQVCVLQVHIFNDERKQEYVANH